MRMHRTLFTALSGGLLVPLVLAAQQQPMARPMSNTQYIRVAESAAPAAIAKNAAIAKINAKGTVTTIREGTNGFTCIVGVPGDPAAPFCADKNALAWVVSATAGLPKPTNTEPGIAYMAQGGVHHETATREIKMAPDSTTHPVKEPPHWMLMWGFDPATSGLSTKENPSGVYIMFAGTPYAHVMIYQDPNKMKP